MGLGPQPGWSWSRDAAREVAVGGLARLGCQIEQIKNTGHSEKSEFQIEQRTYFTISMSYIWAILYISQISL